MKEKKKSNYLLEKQLKYLWIMIRHLGFASKQYGDEYR